ncbi:Cof-type HAD-IIB family hydrolase [Pseudomonas sp. Fl5BN2]|uniref:Cof-type HAD-IIB family hydrolase n=1 Tax=Pseudomonas sp. Fl5BN2 TaxID=2697652 RepID=UPI0013771EDA|nr:Cof-type HAD-IIB family hydrolase [Pseudomonas sp. Fl5BN2]NBF02069.1 Cof-type HAD-IIB family hydrolase [Pseudomonas sp. Fl5BN2]
MSGVKARPIEFLLSDLDGTLLRPDHSLSPRTLDAVRALRDAGVAFSLASGRPPRAMLQQIEALGVDLPTVGFNGGSIVNPDGSCLVRHHVPVAAAVTALLLFEAQPGIETWVFADDQWLLRDLDGPLMPLERQALGYAPKVVGSFDEYLPRIDKIVAASNDHRLLMALETRLQARTSGQAQASRSQPRFLDVTALQADKGQALVTLAKHLGVSLERTAALGDGGNDPAMFQRAGLSIAMGQAEEQVKRQADVITGSNLEDGAAEAIERYILQR